MSNETIYKTQIIKKVSGVLCLKSCDLTELLTTD